MDTIDMQSPDSVAANIEKIAKLWPEVLTEVEGEDGKTTRAVDFDKLKQVLSDDEIELAEGARERYRLDWPGKQRSLLKANTLITKTLRPDREESVEFDTTENVFIEGDNFEALKVLQESYLGKVKMIYIDPPYNTGKDFVYSDKHTMEESEYTELTGAEDEEGNRMFRENTRTNPRFHSDWLSMIYERLLVARDLLKDDGVIFISIDDNEVHNLRKVCDEIFGEEGFVNDFVWVNNLKGRQISNYGAAQTYEHILCYGKFVESIGLFTGDPNFLKELMPTTYRGFNYEIEEDEFGQYVVKNELYNTNSMFNEETRPNLVFNIHYNPDTLEVKFTHFDDEQTYPNFRKITPHANSNGTHRYHAWRWSKDKIQNERKDLKFICDDEACKIYTKIRNFEKTNLKDLITDISTTDGGSETKELFDGKNVFDYPKPTKLLNLLLSVTKNDDMVIDFFSGSATTAHAVMQKNAEDGGNRKYIMVQLPEETPSESEASKAGYETIAQLARERIRRAAAKIQEDYAEQLAEREAPLDTGFRSYYIDSTNMKDVYYHPTEVEQLSLGGMTDNVKDDRTDEDLLTQVMLDLGLTLDLPIEQKTIEGTAAYYVAGNSLVACFADTVNQAIAEAIAQDEPLRVVFKDSSFAQTQDRENLENRFKQLSPDTKIQII